MVVVRLLLALALGVALLAIAMPAVEDTRRATAKTAAEREVSRILATIRALTERSDPTRPAWTATRELPLSIPGPDYGTSGVEWIAVGGVPGKAGPNEPSGTDVLAYSVEGTVTVIRLPGVDIRVSGVGPQQDSRPLVLRDSTTLEFTYRIGPEGPIVTVRAERL